jgi:hypothetical protein
MIHSISDVVWEWKRSGGDGKAVNENQRAGIRGYGKLGYGFGLRQAIPYAPPGIQWTGEDRRSKKGGRDDISPASLDQNKS